MIKIYFHRAIIYILVKVFPKLFIRYFNDYMSMIRKYGKIR